MTREARVIFPNTLRTIGVALVCGLFSVGFMALTIAYRDDGTAASWWFLGSGLFFGFGSVYLLRRRKKPLLRLDELGLTYFPFDDPIAFLRYRGRAFAAWGEVYELTLFRVEGMLFLRVMGGPGGRHFLFRIPLVVLPMQASELLHEIEQRAPHVRMPILT